MERAQTTKKNDAVTLRQFNLFLKTANLPSQFKGTVKQFKDVVQQMPIILQDLLFAEWISKHLKKDPHFPQGKPYPNDQYLMKKMSLQRLYRDIQYDTWRAQHRFSALPNNQLNSSIMFFIVYLPLSINQCAIHD